MLDTLLLRPSLHFIRSIYLLIMLDTLLLRPSLHPTTLHPTTFHFTTLHFLSFQLSPLHFTTLSFSLSPFQPPMTNAHYCTQSQFSYMHFPYLRLTFISAVYLITCLVAKPQGSTLLLSKPTIGHDAQPVPSSFPPHYAFR